MNVRRKNRTLIDRLKAYYRHAEMDAAKLPPFYVAGDGVMYAQPKEVLRSTVVINQLTAFESLRQELKVKEKEKENGSLVVDGL
ncbi:hypothetical protein FA160_20735 [Pseudomonas aeruginosa]|nr:hypothetical protein [Pseudomonas aeruginosa]